MCVCVNVCVSMYVLEEGAEDVAALVEQIKRDLKVRLTREDIVAR